MGIQPVPTDPATPIRLMFYERPLRVMALTVVAPEKRIMAWACKGEGPKAKVIAVSYGHDEEEARLALVEALEVWRVKEIARVAARAHAAANPAPVKMPRPTSGPGTHKRIGQKHFCPCETCTCFRIVQFPDPLKACMPCREGFHNNRRP